MAAAYPLTIALEQLCGSRVFVTVMLARNADEFASLRYLRPAISRYSVSG